MKNRDYAFDHYSKEAQKFGYRSRAALKLVEIDEKFNLFAVSKNTNKRISSNRDESIEKLPNKNINDNSSQTNSIAGIRVLDLGAAPGGWCQATQKILKKKQIYDNARIVGLDILPIESLTGVEFIKCDISDYDGMGEFDVVLNDMCPNKTGNSTVDNMRLYNLAELALQTAKKALTPQGKFVCKFFYGASENEFKALLHGVFKKCVIFKPKSSRDVSSEFYFYCSELKV